ncbi:site-specific integrase [Candidatus Bathyarchaeota archaeon]|nr:MAG: site-specific integrase [Candidatus Bathyarchaeota archaeon]
MVKAPACPQCGSKRVWKDGLRYTSAGTIQRYICRVCGYRFSEPSKNLRSFGAKTCISNACQERALLAEVIEKEKRVAGATTDSKAKSAIINFLWQLKKEGYTETTIWNYRRYLNWLLKAGANLLDPESVKETIAKRKGWNETTKCIVSAAYATFAKINGIPFKPPRYKAAKKLPFIPLEEEIDALIAASGRKLACLLQLLKETGMRINEALNLQWKDVDFKRNVITLNAPEKRNNARAFKISDQLASMLKTLPMDKPKVFGITYHTAEQCLLKTRKRLARKLGNPRLLRITFHTLRHWKATMEYHKTKDILHVMKMLGHRHLESTLVYTQLVNFKTEEYHSAVAHNVEEARRLIEQGFEYVCEVDGVHVFRKRK